jgi:sterol desaturase/sphingolipid hydroxylase (fatty acid hydroxylase superfamily)
MTAATQKGGEDYRQFSRAPASKPATWHTKPSSDWDGAQKFIMHLNALQDPPNSERPPVHAKTDPVPVYPVWRQHAWILPRLLPPLIAHRIFMELTGWSVHPAIAFPFYLISLVAFLKPHVGVLRRMGKAYGFFDGKHERDGVPDEHSWKVLKSVISTLALRPLIAVFFVYDRNEKPSVSWQTPFDVVAFTLAVDMFFYGYHRAMHEVPWLWQLHRLHHTTKHPNVLLSAYADEIQEVFDMIVIPWLAYLVVPQSFTSWYIAMGYMIYTEAAGHSGVRLYWQIPTTFWLRWFGCELALESHDLHHQQGYRSSGDYGKQSRLWDGIFGTMRPRVESFEENLDWKTTVKTL